MVPDRILYVEQFGMSALTLTLAVESVHSAADDEIRKALQIHASLGSGYARIARIREDENLRNVDAVFGQRKEEGFLRHITAVGRRERCGIEEWCAIRDDPIIAGERVLRRGSEEAFQDRLAG